MLKQAEIAVKEQLVPASVQQAMKPGQLCKLAAAEIGVPELTLTNVSQFLGTKLAEKRRRWRTVADGLVALKHLQR